ncbi:MAG: hypothetical protein H7Y02_11940 [Candidatus Obscuribacterales bacterium]|nr:hypothetical protein [Steroidobacteraceae bacterium]
MKKLTGTLLLLSLAMRVSAAESERSDVYNVGASYSEDEAYAVQAGADLAVWSRSRFQLGGTYAHSKDVRDDVDTYQGYLNWDQHIAPFGFVLGVEYWGDRSRINSYAGRGAGYYQSDTTRVAVSFERKKIEFSYDLPLALRAFVSDSQTVYGNGYGLSVSQQVARAGLYARGTYYDYTVPFRRFEIQDSSSVPLLQLPLLQERVEDLRRSLRRANSSSLRLANNLLDYSVSVGIDYAFGEQTVNVEVNRDRGAVDHILINTFSAGWAMPIYSNADVELRVGTAHADTVSSLFGSISFSFYH